MNREQVSHFLQSPWIPARTGPLARDTLILDPALHLVPSCSASGSPPQPSLILNLKFLLFSLFRHRTYCYYCNDDNDDDGGDVRVGGGVCCLALQDRKQKPGGGLVVLFTYVALLQAQSLLRAGVE